MSSSNDRESLNYEDKIEVKKSNKAKYEESEESEGRVLQFGEEFGHSKYRY